MLDSKESVTALLLGCAVPVLTVREPLLKILRDPPFEVEVSDGVTPVNVDVNVVLAIEDVVAPGWEALIWGPEPMLSVTCSPMPGPHCRKTRVVDTVPAGAAVTVVVGTHVVVITPRFVW